MYWAIKYTGLTAESGCLNIPTFERRITLSVSNILNKSPDNGEPPNTTVVPRFYWISPPLVFQDKYISRSFWTAPNCDILCMSDFLK